MTSQLYNWKRFWCPRDGTFSLSDGGYLYDPDTEWGKSVQKGVVSFDALMEAPCLGLVGEPGAGKSTAMGDERAKLESQVAQTGGKSLWIDLRGYQTDVRLCKAIFANPTFQEWSGGNYRLHLFLDSLDECLLRVDPIASILIDELRNYPVERLALRIACRTAEWPKVLEQGLIELWGTDAVGIHELLPLRRCDVVDAARINNIDPDTLLREIDRVQAVPLAIKPITLNFLLNLYSRAGQRLPSTQVQLYERGCRLLCEEMSESRRSAGRVGNLSADQRMAVASRIAAVTIFANRYAIWTGIDRGDVPKADVTIQDLSGRTELVDDEEVPVNDDVIRETLATGLFSSRGLERIGWAHQTYAEFLAARYLVTHNMTLNQILSLLSHPAEGKVVPQLQEAAAWVASMSAELLDFFIENEPELLLRSDVATGDEVRSHWVRHLLELYDQEKLLDVDLDLRQQYRKLYYSELSLDLRPYIIDKAKGSIVRRVAIDIAEACELNAVQDDLLTVAVDTSEDYQSRVQAAYALGRIGDQATRWRLRPLGEGTAGNDPDDELKGCGLRALWPELLSAEELFSLLTPPKRGDFLGAYRAFLRGDLAERLQPSSLPVALRWVESLGSHDCEPFNNLADNIILKAWSHLDAVDVLHSLARAVLSRIREHGEIVSYLSQSRFHELVATDEEKRRRLIKALIPLLSDPPREATWLLYGRSPLLTRQDTFWLIALLEQTTSEEEQIFIAHLIRRVFDHDDPQQIDAVIVGTTRSVVLRAEMSRLIDPVQLDSPQARGQIEFYLEQEEWKTQRENENPSPESSAALRTAELLGQCESGDSTAFWKLNLVLAEEGHQPQINELESDLRQLPGWKGAEHETRTRIIEAAKTYLLKQDPEPEKWLGTNIIYRPAFAGYRSFLLLMDETPEFVASLPAETWQKWTPIILAYPIATGNEEEIAHQQLVGLCYKHAPVEIISTLNVLIDEENERHGTIYVNSKLEHCWDDTLIVALEKKAQDPSLKPESMRMLLSDLLDHDAQQAKAFAESLISLPFPNGAEARNKAVAAARGLMLHARDGGWSIVWPAMQQDVEYGRAVTLAVAHFGEAHQVTIGRRLREDQLADLYIWLERHFPHTEDPTHQGAYAVGPRDSVASWRDGILRHLQNIGTYEACDAIREIAQELPGLDWLKWVLYRAQTQARRSTWTPSEPAHIILLAENRQTRLVRNGDELLEVILESLWRLQERLQGETPAVRDIWDKVGNRYRPIDEPGLSDYIKRHLDHDLKERGVIANREVEIRRPVGPDTGERTDIHVDAVIPGAGNQRYDVVTVILENKGCWNPDLNSAMTTQLADRYLKDNQCNHGLYIVGWFSCSQWDDEDYRKRQVPRISLTEAQEGFELRAAELSRDDKSIRVFILNAAFRE